MDPKPRTDAQAQKCQILEKLVAISERTLDSNVAIEFLLESLNSQDPDISLSALHATGLHISSEILLEKVLELAKKGKEEEIRAGACGCLGAVMQDGMAFEDHFEFEGEILAPSVSSQSYLQVKCFLLQKVDAPMESMEVRRRALEALGHIAFLPQVHKLVLRFFHEAPNPSVRLSAVYAMGLVRNDVFERLVLEELYNEDADIVLEAIHSCHNLELHAAEERLLELTKSSELDVVCEAVAALGAVAKLEGFPYLYKTLSLQYSGEEVQESLSIAHSIYLQRMKMRQGHPLWEDEKVWEEIQAMLEGPSHGDLPE